MPRVQVGFIDWVRGMACNAVRVRRYRPPKVRKQAVCVVYGFAFWRMGPGKQNRAAAEKWLNIVLHVAKGFPNNACNARFPAKPNKRGLNHSQPRQMFLGKTPPPP